MGTGDEDQSLGDDSDLEVNNHVQLGVVGLDGEGGHRNTELVLEEVRLQDGTHEGNAIQKKEVSTWMTTTKKNRTYVEAVR